jgi:LacI family transcriptional regulator
MFTSVGHPRRIFSGASTRLALADGALLLGRDPDLEGIRKLVENDYPFVYIGHREIDGLPISYVAADYAQATRQHVERLVGLGHRAIAYVRLGDGASLPSRDRIEGFRAGASEAGISSAEAPVWDVGSVAEATSSLETARRLGITAIVAEQQTLAEAFETAARGRGLGVPIDLSISVLGDVIGASAASRQWSGFSVAGHEMGSAALHLLTRILDGLTDGPEQLAVPCDPIAGDTVAAAPAGHA